MPEVITLFSYVGGKAQLVPHLVESIMECCDKYPEIDTFIEACVTVKQWRT